MTDSTDDDIQPLRKRDSPLDPSVRDRLAKSDAFEKVGFNASISGSHTIFKNDNGEFIIWGPASVEVVDKEGDRIRAKALADALPQLLKRARLSLEHSDQLVGRILDGFSVDQPVTVKIGENEYDRTEFPTDVLELDGQQPALYVAGEIYSDTRQSKETRKRIKDGELDSYSISGEALVTRKKIEDGDAYDDIVDMDLSAVTICEEGMNQKAKFGTVKDDDGAKETVKIDDGADVDDSDRVFATTTGPATADMADVATVRATAKSTQIMSNDDDGSPATETLRNTLKSVLTEELPDGDLATKADVEQTIEEMAKEGDIPWPGETAENDKTTGPAQGDAGPSETGEGSDGSDDELNEGVESPQEKADEPVTRGEFKSLLDDYFTEKDAAEDETVKADGETHSATENEMGDPDDASGDGDEANVEGGDGSLPDSGDVDKADAIAAFADDFDVSKDDLAALVGGEDEDEEVPVDEPDDVVEAPEAEAPVEVPDEEVEDDEAEADEDVPVPEAKGDGLSMETLEQQLPADVYEVVQEYVDDPAGEGGADEMPPAPEEGGDDMAPPAPGEKAEKADDADEDAVRDMVKSVLEGEGITRVDGASTEADTESVEKSYDGESTENSSSGNPALANFYPEN